MTFSIQHSCMPDLHKPIPILNIPFGNEPTVLFTVKAKSNLRVEFNIDLENYIILTRTPWIYCQQILSKILGRPVSKDETQNYFNVGAFNFYRYQCKVWKLITNNYIDYKNNDYKNLFAKLYSENNYDNYTFYLEITEENVDLINDCFLLQDSEITEKYFEKNFEEINPKTFASEWPNHIPAKNFPYAYYFKKHNEDLEFHYRNKGIQYYKDNKTGLAAIKVNLDKLSMEVKEQLGYDYIHRQVIKDYCNFVRYLNNNFKTIIFSDDIDKPSWIAFVFLDQEDYQNANSKPYKTQFEVYAKCVKIFEQYNDAIRGNQSNIKLDSLLNKQVQDVEIPDIDTERNILLFSQLIPFNFLIHHLLNEIDKKGWIDGVSHHNINIVIKEFVNYRVNCRKPHILLNKRKNGVVYNKDLFRDGSYLGIRLPNEITSSSHSCCLDTHSPIRFQQHAHFYQSTEVLRDHPELKEKYYIATNPNELQMPDKYYRGLFIHGHTITHGYEDEFNLCFSPSFLIFKHSDGKSIQDSLMEIIKKYRDSLTFVNRRYEKINMAYADIEKVVNELFEQKQIVSVENFINNLPQYESPLASYCFAISICYNTGLYGLYSESGLIFSNL